MTSMSDLWQDLVEEILSKVPITSLGAVRATCKGWNTLSKNRILCTGEPKQQFLGFTMLNHRLCSMRFNMEDVHKKDDEEFVDPSIKEIGNFLNHVKILDVYQCNGLLLCVPMDNSRLVIWNPYLGQTKWIQLKTITKSMYALGYDKNKNHKILRFFNYNQGYYKIYDVKSSSWKTFTVIPNWDIIYYRQGVSLHGNTYFWTEGETHEFLICYDFTEERFGKFLDLPFQPDDSGFGDRGDVSCVKEDKLAALYHHCDVLSIIEIWITTKIEPNAVSWIPFLKVDCEPISGLDLVFDEDYNSFFVDEEKKLVVVFSSCSDEPEDYQKAYIIGEDSYFKKVELGEVKAYHIPLVCSTSYVPSLVQINQTAGPKRRENKKKRKQNHAAIKAQAILNDYNKNLGLNPRSGSRATIPDGKIIAQTDGLLRTPPPKVARLVISTQQTECREGLPGVPNNVGNTVPIDFVPGTQSSAIAHSTGAAATNEPSPILPAPQLPT
ncbi:PREDICTED: F-box protein At3g19880-like [Camelina sativa]|uniref:F-box protein At3g19880-like n=1 Tax=Camelina sativa TaxID=90675 RepID=A0ABM1RBM2_CAMSA|nr:PREDICTED: F-box protein At3g19880-like [Camelina sativa]